MAPPTIRMLLLLFLAACLAGPVGAQAGETGAPVWHRAAARWQYSSASSVPVWEVLDMAAASTPAARAANVTHPTTVAAVPLPLPPGTACRELLIDLPIVRKLGRYDNRRAPLRATFHLWRASTTAPVSSPTPIDIAPPTLLPPPLGVPYQAAPPVATLHVSAPDTADWATRDNGREVDLGEGAALYEVSVRRFRLDLVAAGLGAAGLVVREGEPLALGVSIALERVFNASDHSSNEARWATVATRNAPPLREDGGAAAAYRFLDRGGAFYRAHPTLVNWTAAAAAEPIVSQFLVYGAHLSDSRELAWALYGHCTPVDAAKGAGDTIPARFPDWAPLAEGDADRDAGSGAPAHTAHLYASYSEDQRWQAPTPAVSVPPTATGGGFEGFVDEIKMVLFFIVGALVVAAIVVAFGVGLVVARRRYVDWRKRRFRRTNPHTKGGTNMTYNFETGEYEPDDGSDGSAFHQRLNVLRGGGVVSKAPPPAAAARKRGADRHALEGDEALSQDEDDYRDQDSGDDDDTEVTLTRGVPIGDNGEPVGTDTRPASTLASRFFALFKQGAGYQSPGSAVAHTPDETATTAAAAGDTTDASASQHTVVTLNDSAERASHAGAAVIFSGESSASGSFSVDVLPGHAGDGTVEIDLRDAPTLSGEGDASRHPATVPARRSRQRRRSSATNADDAMKGAIRRSFGSSRSGSGSDTH